MIIECIYEWAKRRPNKTAVIRNDISLSYLALSNTIRTAYDFFSREDLPTGWIAIVLVHDLLDAWIIVIALRALGLNTIAVRSMEAVETLKIRDIACIIVTQTEAAAHNLTIQAKGSKVVTTPSSIVSIKDANELPAIQHNRRPFGGHILYTSGTTGTYRKIMMSGEHEDRRNYSRVQAFSFDSNTIYQGIDFPLWTGMGFKIPPAIWYAGGCIVLDQRKERYENFFRTASLLHFLFQRR